eukprot:TRINITY_DN16554_c0_g1_i1.p1 TRINITY_DN16554_c0_g1~~TRINITY_DN16554_c0_g1_i1.p1  ORF type:complete len:151 (+),score=21.26 TRINITY_DN16554_c0_g1_i1:28-480(+)
MAFATMAHSPGFKRSQMRSRVSLFALLTCLLATYTICEVTFFDFFGKPPDTPSTRETGLKTASYGQIMTLKRLRKSQEVDSRWLSYCEAANASAAEVVKLTALVQHHYSYTTLLSKWPADIDRCNAMLSLSLLLPWCLMGTCMMRPWKGT